MLIFFIVLTLFCAMGFIGSVFLAFAGFTTDGPGLSLIGILSAVVTGSATLYFGLQVFLEVIHLVAQAVKTA